MTVPIVTMDQILTAVEDYQAKKRPWRQTFNRVSWFILVSGHPYPLKYIYALAAHCPPATFTTNQMKSVLRKIPIECFKVEQHDDIARSFNSKVVSASAEPEKRKERLKHADKVPVQIVAYRVAYNRNPDVVAEVLERANGVCEACGESAPFTRASNGTPYLEVHHRVFLSDGGLDCVDNAEAICPNCHRKKHFG